MQMSLRKIELPFHAHWLSENRPTTSMHLTARNNDICCIPSHSPHVLLRLVVICASRRYKSTQTMPVTRAVAELMHDITIKENKSFKEHPHFYTTLQDMTTEEQNNLATQYFDNYHKIQFFYDLEDHIIGSKYKLCCFIFVHSVCHQSF